MSFQKKGITSEPKRPYQWLVDASHPELCCNKRQEREAVSSISAAGTSNGSIFLWDNSSKLQSVLGGGKNFSPFIISAGHAYKKGRENFISTRSNYSNDNGNFISVGRCNDKYGKNTISMRPASYEADTNVISLGTLYANRNIGNPLMGETGGIPFGDFQNAGTNPSGVTASGYNLTANIEPSAQTSKELRLENSTEIVAPAATSKTKATPKSKETKPSKKVVPSSFPSNVKSLLSTGILDGVPVKYVSWSREHSLKGIAKGSGYLCGCKDCKFSKSLNAHELERHAGCKTKHPNNHIYFQNGKTVYAVVQELQNTPQEMLFETIQKITGSPINQKNFNTWKASYEAASRELQRIYGKGALVEAS